MSPLKNKCLRKQIPKEYLRKGFIKRTLQLDNNLLCFQFITNHLTQSYISRKKINVILDICA